MVAHDDHPRWRGFNLLGKFRAEDESAFREEDFRWMAEWGFDFARLPMDYRCWTGETQTDIVEEALHDIDEAIEYGEKHGIHVSLNFHRIPGFCINRQELEPYDLFADEQALEDAAEHWRTFARRYREIDSERLSFNLFNEPVAPSEDAYEAVLETLVGAIREEDPERLIVADGLGAGRKPLGAFAELGVAGGTRGYDPHEVTHYKADWVEGADEFPTPEWPRTVEGGEQNREWLRENVLAPWEKLETGVHVGEFGVYNETPHNVALALIEDYLALWEELGWGWALWNFRGEFGVLDSGRDDIEYEDWHGHDLDRELLELLRRY